MSKQKNKTINLGIEPIIIPAHSKVDIPIELTPEAIEMINRGEAFYVTLIWCPQWLNKIWARNVVFFLAYVGVYSIIVYTLKIINATITGEN